MNRREFIESLVALTAALAVAPRATAYAGDEAPPAGTPPPAAATIPLRRLGATGASVTMLGAGGFHIGACANEHAAREVIDAALAEGIRFFDTAESYQSGKSEEWLGAALAGVRKDVFLMTKTYAPADRSAESAKRHLDESLKRLRTDKLDLWQLHSIQSAEDVDRAFAAGGAMEYILEMKRQGVIRFTGVTGHVRPAAQLRALEHWDRGAKFDAMQLPLNPIDFHQHSFQREVLPGLVQREIGIIAMKTSASGALLRERICTIEECLAFVWSLPVALAVVGMESVEQVRANAKLARDHQALAPEAIEKLLERIQPKATLALEWYKQA